MPDETPTEIEAFTQAKWAGALKALTQYLPHLIGVIAIAISGFLATFNHLHEQSDTQKVWQHSGVWASNIVSLQLSVSNLQEQIKQLENRPIIQFGMPDINPNYTNFQPNWYVGTNELVNCANQPKGTK